MCLCAWKPACMRTSGSQSRLVVVFWDVTLDSGAQLLAAYHKACVSRVKKEKEKKRDGSTCLVLWLFVFSGWFLFFFFFLLMNPAYTAYLILSLQIIFCVGLNFKFEIKRPVGKKFQL